MDVYFYMVIALALLAIVDLIVGVSNDAVNFLNSAIGSKAVSFKTIMIVASVGIASGAIFSSGLMEVARKGIFTPGEFYFSEIMIIFMAVMITDILLLDLFNTLGLPTSTTVSIVFNLLGAAVGIACIKIWNSPELSIVDLSEFINTTTAVRIVSGILLSVVIAFTVGAVVQYITRILLSYNFEKKASWISSVFGGIALTALLYFIFMKGIKGTNYAKAIIDTVYQGDSTGILAWANDYLGTSYQSMKELTKATKYIFKIDTNTGTVSRTLRGILELNVKEIILLGMLLFSALSYVLIEFFKFNIYKLVIVIGTFGLALAFSGNDLVNFIGVPIAGWQSYESFVSSGLSADEFLMSGLAKKSETPTVFLFISGIIMVLTLWFSKKARYVAETEINLSKDGAAQERFAPNFLSRGIVRFVVQANVFTQRLLPDNTKAFIERRFLKPKPVFSILSTKDQPAFDMVRAAVNLVVAGILISIATSMKLPLSTTYVTFMVAMGTSLADRAWGTESAVYRVAGVLNVIGGWFSTAFCAFIASSIVALMMYYGGNVAIVLLLLGVIVIIVRNAISYNKKVKITKEEDRIKALESNSMQGVIQESSQNIRSFANRSVKIYNRAFDGLSIYNLQELKKAKKQISKLDTEVEELRNSIFYFIKNLEDSSVKVSKFYINVIGSLQDMSDSLAYITKSSHKHVNNNHQKLKFNQVKDLKQIQSKIEQLFLEISDCFKQEDFSKIDKILYEKKEFFDYLNNKIDEQVTYIRVEEDSPINTTLYFGILMKTRDFIASAMNLLEIYRENI